MALKAPADRPVYTNSGYVRVLPLMWGACMGTAASVFISAAMMGLQWVGFYLVIMVPALAGFAVGGLAMLVVYQSHCRNWLLAGCMGFAMGCLSYLGYYHLDLLNQVGYDKWQRVDVLPFYINARWENDTIGKVGQDGGVPNYWMNMAMSVFEILMMGGISGAMAMSAGGKPYAERARCWMSKSAFKCQVGSSVAIAQALVSKTTDALPAAIIPSESDDPGYNECELWFCPPHRDPEGDEPIYFTMTEHGPANKEGNRASTAVVQCWQLEPREIAAFAQPFPDVMSRILGKDLLGQKPAATQTTANLPIDPADAPAV
jgi:hypothetical protein